MNPSEFKYPSKFAVGCCRAFGLCVSKIFWRIEFRGLENIPQDLEGGLLVAPNHQTYADPVWVCLKVFRNFRFMAWDAAFDWFLIGRMIRYLGAFPVGFGRRGFVKASRMALQALREGATLIIFPEGEREFSDGKLLDFKDGAIRLAMEAGVPVLPVTIRGANRIWAQGMKMPRLGKVTIIYHPVIKVPVPSEGQNVHEHIRGFNQKLKEVIASAM